jgi:hypothetical protein
MNSSNDEVSINAGRVEGVVHGKVGVSAGITLATTVMIALAGFGPARANDGARTPVAEFVSSPSDPIRPNVATIMDLAETRPIAAVALLSIVQDKQSPLSYETIGNSIILTAVPTPDTVKKMLEHADGGIVRSSMQPLSSNPHSLDDGRFLMISWNQSALPNGEVLLRISAELVDGMFRPCEPPETFEAQTIVALRKSDTGLLTWVRPAS